MENQILKIMTYLLPFLLSLTLFVLGFLALIKQKNYIDSKTNMPTEISIPLIGKLKTNYPALIFVVLGVLLFKFSLDHNKPVTDKNWTIAVKLNSDKEGIDWSETRFNLKTIGYSDEKSGDGMFFITVHNIPEEESIEDKKLNYIVISHPDLKTKDINIHDELEKKSNGEDTCLKKFDRDHRLIEIHNITLNERIRN